MECEPVQWGAVSLPYTLWRRMIVDMAPALGEKDIPIFADMLEMWVGSLKFTNAGIIATKLDRVPLEIPADAEPIEIVQFAMAREITTLMGSAAWGTIKSAIERVRKQMERACEPVKKYGVTVEDICKLVAQRVGIENQERFIQTLFRRSRGRR